jgi:hypothetical protein
MLVDDGGRPSHPLTRLEDIVENPGEYREILTFWQGKYADPDEDEWRVFGTQLGRWKDFRGLQRFARGQRGYDYWRSIWEENRKMGTLEHPEMPALGSPELERDWQRNQDDHDNYVRSGTSYIPWKLFIDKTTDQQGFPEYAEALKGRLARHGFTRPFQLDEDAAQQDKITTWIEYLGYEYWWYDYHVDIITHYQKRHDDAWNKLVESKVLRPGETEEVVCDTNRIFQDWGELKTSEKAIESAVSAVSSAETAVAEWREESKLSLQTLQQQLFAARSQLEAAQAEDEPLQTRSNHISEFMQRTMTYQIATDDANHHSKLLPWMLQQVPLIEAEMNPSNERDSDKRGKSVVLKRNHSQSEELNEDDQQQSRSEGVSNHNADRQVPVAISSQEPPSMRPKRTTRLSNNLTKGTLVPKRACKPRKVNGQASSNQSPTFNPPRRSARIAERLRRVDAAITTITQTQKPTPLLSTRSNHLRRSARIMERA